MKPIYLDHNATTPLDPRVLQAMRPFLETNFGNAGSVDHVYGQEAARAVSNAAGQAAALMGARPEEIVWTSGATESCNLALQGMARRYVGRGRHILTQATEHAAVLDTCRQLQREGFEVTILPVDGTGRVDPQDLHSALRSDTILVSIMFANNETGTVQPVAELAALCRARGVPLHSDATQAYGRTPVDVDEVGIDLLSASAHKIYGPKGTGILYLRGGESGLHPQPLIHGGGHQRGLRSGTLNVPGIVGFGAAAELCGIESAAEARRLTDLRDALQGGLQQHLREVMLNGHSTQRLPNTLNVAFAGIDSRSLVQALPDLAFSRGAACTTARPGPSHVLQAQGATPEQLYGAVRFSLGRGNTPDDIDRVIRRVTETVTALRRRTAAPEQGT